MDPLSALEALALSDKPVDLAGYDLQERYYNHDLDLGRFADFCFILQATKNCQDYNQIFIQKDEVSDEEVISTVLSICDIGTTLSRMDGLDRFDLLSDLAPENIAQEVADSLSNVEAPVLPVLPVAHPRTESLSSTIFLQSRKTRSNVRTPAELENIFSKFMGIDLSNFLDINQVNVPRWFCKPEYTDSWLYAEALDEEHIVTLSCYLNDPSSTLSTYSRFYSYCMRAPSLDAYAILTSNDNDYLLNFNVESFGLLSKRLLPDKYLGLLKNYNVEEFNYPDWSLLERRWEIHP